MLKFTGIQDVHQPISLPCPALCRAQEDAQQLFRLASCQV